MTPQPIWMQTSPPTGENVAPASTSKTEASSTQLNFAKEEVPGGPLLLAAYMAMWIIVFAFVVASWRHQRTLSRQVASLEARIDAKIGAQQHGNSK